MTDMDTKIIAQDAAEKATAMKMELIKTAAMNTVQAVENELAANEHDAAAMIEEERNITDMAAKEFEEILNIIGEQAENTKINVQRAIKYVVRCIIYRKDVKPAERLDSKLKIFESRHYHNAYRKNLAAWCGYCEPVALPKKGTVYYYKEKPFLYYSNEKGKKGWQINTKRWQECHEQIRTTYEAYFINELFMHLPIKKKPQKQTIGEKFINMAKDLQDTINSEIKNTKDLWESIDSPWIKLLEYLDKAPKIEVKKD